MFKIKKMKKVFSFSVIILLGYSVFAQDTLLRKNSDSMRLRMDTSMSVSPSKEKMDTALNSNSNSTINSGSSSMDSTKKTAEAPANQTNTSVTTTVTTDTTAKVAVSDRIVMKDDKVYVVKNNESVFLEKNYKLESGAIVTAAGMVKYPSGKSAQLKNGQSIELKKPTTTEAKKTIENKKSNVTTHRKKVQ